MYFYVTITILLTIALLVGNYFLSNSFKQIVYVCIFSLMACGVWTYSYIGLTGIPRPLDLTYLDQDVYLKDFYMKDNVSIYIWLITDDSTLSIVIPWSPELAEALYKAKGNEKRTGKKSKINLSKLKKALGKVGEGEGEGDGDGQGTGQTGDAKTGNGQSDGDEVSNSLTGIDQSFKIEERKLYQK